MDARRSAVNSPARLLRASSSNMLAALAGDRPHYEEATRGLCADDLERLEQFVVAWPRDLRDYTLREARAQAERAETGERVTRRVEAALVERGSC